jgi:hypothetical protein
VLFTLERESAIVTLKREKRAAVLLTMGAKKRPGIASGPQFGGFGF